MARRHLLEVYRCTGDRYCVGCFDDGAPADTGESSDPTDRPAHSSPPRDVPPPRARPATATPAPGPEDPAPTAPVVVLRAQWTRDGIPTERARPGQILTLRATVYEAPSGAVATFEVQHRDTGASTTLEVDVGGELAAGEFAPAYAGEYRFEVRVGAARASSGDLVVEADRPPLKLCHIGQVLCTLLADSRVVARWYFEDLSYEFLCGLAEQGPSDPENDPGHMPRELCLLPGIEGDDVREAQRALAALGQSVAESGVFDVATKAAVLRWLPSIQPDREAIAAASRQRVAEGGTFAELCAAGSVREWTDLWHDNAPGVDDDPDSPGTRSFGLPSRSQRTRGHALLEETGRETTPAYGGLAYLSPVVTYARTLVFSDGSRAPLSDALTLEVQASTPGTFGQGGGRTVARLARGTKLRLVARRPLERVPDGVLGRNTDARAEG